MNKKYITKGAWLNKITSVTIDKETASSVWVDGRKKSKRSGYENYHDSFAEAKAFLMAECDDKMRQAQSQYDNAKAMKSKINELKEHE